MELEENKLKKLSSLELKSISGGNPILVVYATAVAVYHVALESLRSKGYHDGKKSAHCS